MTAPLDDAALGGRLHALLSRSLDPVVVAAFAYGGVVRFGRVDVASLLGDSGPLVVYAVMGRLSAPVVRYVCLGAVDEVLTESPAAFARALLPGLGAPGAPLEVRSVEDVLRLGAAFLEWVRPLDRPCGNPEDFAELPRVARVIAALERPNALELLERLVRLTKGTEAERAAVLRGELPARALSADERLRALAGRGDPPRSPSPAAVPGSDGFQIFKRGRYQPEARGGRETVLDGSAPSAPAVFGAEAVSFEALAPAVLELGASRRLRSASWNGYRGRLITLFVDEGAPLFLELRIERDARVRARALWVG